MELKKDKVMVEWDDSTNEGISGDYDPDDPNDIPLLRFYVNKLVSNEWEELPDASYCTQVDARTSNDIQRKLLQVLMDEVYEEVKSGHSIKKLCEQLSWIDPSWVDTPRKKQYIL
jgi:hypothetical protein